MTAAVTPDPQADLVAAPPAPNLRDELAWSYVFWICRDGHNLARVRQWVEEDLAANANGSRGQIYRRGLSPADAMIAGPLAAALEHRENAEASGA